MNFLIKGDAMASGSRTTAQGTSTSGRYAVGLFGGKRHEPVRATGYVRRGPRPTFPPHTLVLVRLHAA